MHFVWKFLWENAEENHDDVVWNDRSLKQRKHDEAQFGTRLTVSWKKENLEKHKRLKHDEADWNKNYIQMLFMFTYALIANLLID